MKNKKVLVVSWKTVIPKKKATVKYAPCGSNCYSGTCSSCKN